MIWEVEIQQVSRTLKFAAPGGGGAFDSQSLLTSALRYLQIEFASSTLSL